MRQVGCLQRYYRDARSTEHKIIAVNLENVIVMLNLELMFIVVYGIDVPVSKLTYRKFVLETIECRITRTKLLTLCGIFSLYFHFHIIHCQADFLVR